MFIAWWLPGKVNAVFVADISIFLIYQRDTALLMCSLFTDHAFGAAGVADAAILAQWMLEFWHFLQEKGSSVALSLTVRDLLAWVRLWLCLLSLLLLHDAYRPSMCFIALF